MRSVRFIVCSVGIVTCLGRAVYAQRIEWSPGEDETCNSYRLTPFASGSHAARNAARLAEGPFASFGFGEMVQVIDTSSSVSSRLGIDRVLYSVVADDVNTDFPSTLMTIDPFDGSQTQAGPVGSTFEPRAMDAHPVSGRLLGVDWWDDGGPNTSVIYEIDSSTGFSTPIATITEYGFTFQMLALAFSPDGTLYATSGADYPQSGFKIGRVDLATETFHPIIQINRANPIWAAGMDFSPNGVLYAALTEQFPDYSQTQTLATIDLETAEVAQVGPFESYYIGDIDYASDCTIYSTNHSWWLIRIDPANASSATVGWGPLGALNGLASFFETRCLNMDSDCDGDIDLKDYAAWQNCLSGPN